jgi:hypothetical protein
MNSRISLGYSFANPFDDKRDTRVQITNPSKRLVKSHSQDQSNV